MRTLMSMTSYLPLTIGAHVDQKELSEKYEMGEADVALRRHILRNARFMTTRPVPIRILPEEVITVLVFLSVCEHTVRMLCV